MRIHNSNTILCFARMSMVWFVWKIIIFCVVRVLYLRCFIVHKCIICCIIIRFTRPWFSLCVKRTRAVLLFSLIKHVRIALRNLITATTRKEFLFIRRMRIWPRLGKMILFVYAPMIALFDKICGLFSRF